MRPRILIDIANKEVGRLKCPLPRRIHLPQYFSVTIPMTRIVRFAFMGIIIVSATAFAVAPTLTNPLVGSLGVSMAAGNAAAEAQRKQLETQLAQLEGQITAYENTIASYSKQGNTLQSEIKRLETRIAKINLQIKAVTLTLTKLDAEIADTGQQIARTESTIFADKDRLSGLLQSVYASDREGLLAVFLKNHRLSDFALDVNNLIMVQVGVQGVIQDIIAAKNKLVDQKEALALQRADTEALKEYQDTQRASIKQTQSEKATLLQVTKGKESAYQILLVKTKQTAAEIRKQIFQILGGGELSFDDAYKLAKMAENATGVRAALLLAVLDRESALGKNVGRCDYKAAMRPSEIPIFLAIVGQVGLQSNLDGGLLKVSCPNGDGTYGGAMGPAQFLPSTWNLYQAQITGVTGNMPPSPWRNADAFVATALYLKDAGAANTASLNAERQAAARYYAGARWKSYLWTYGDRVVSLAQRFQSDIDILNGQGG